MSEVINLEIDKNRGVVMQTIRLDLYPEEEFPRRLFPNLSAVLFDCFMEVVKSRGDWLDLYRTSEDKEKIENLTREILEFKNLLAHHPQTVVLMYRTYIKKFVKYKQAVAAGGNEWEDIFQEIITRLLSDKMQRIQQQFDFSYQYKNFSKRSLFTSYLMVVVRNIYMDIIRERSVRPLTTGHVLPIDEVLEHYDDRGEDMLSRLVIDRECRKLKTVLALYYMSQARLELCLKLKCRILLSREDVSCCFPGSRGEDLSILLQDFKGVKDKELFDMVVPVFNRLEGRINKSDSLRKWVSVRLDEIAAQMNRTHGTDVYNSKNLMDLIDFYYEGFKKNTSAADKEEANHGSEDDS